MTIPPDKIADFRFSQLSMVQANIARIGNYGATIKNWCITLTTAVCGFALTVKFPALIWLALLPIFVFALMDAEYLRVERQFRKTYDRIRNEDWATPPNFDVSPDTSADRGLIAVLGSWSILSFYMPLAVAIVVIGLILHKVGIPTVGT
jgi:hypothetical protein